MREERRNDILQIDCLLLLSGILCRRSYAVLQDRRTRQKSNNRKDPLYIAKMAVNSPTPGTLEKPSEDLGERIRTDGSVSLLESLIRRRPFVAGSVE